jgi:putative transposase
MYRFRRSTPEARLDLIYERLEREFPPHSPPHLDGPERTFLITAACYEHRALLLEDHRRLELLTELQQLSHEHGARLEAWVVLPNHYHLLAHAPSIREIGKAIGLVHGRTSRRWNEEDDRAGRKCWYRFADRAIRSDSHYFACLNYIHANPVKHGFVRSGLDWAASSVHQFESDLGIQALRDLWRRYPVGDMGKDWDD